MKPLDTVEVVADCQDSRGRTFTAGQRGQVAERQGNEVLVEFEGYDHEREEDRLRKEKFGMGAEPVSWSGWLRVDDLVVREISVEIPMDPDADEGTDGAVNVESSSS